MPSAASLITARVRDRVRAERLDLHRDPAAADRLAREELRRYAERSLGGGTLPVIDDEAQTLGEVLAGLIGYGPLQPYFDDPEVEEIWINSPDAVFIARGGVSERTALELTDEEVRTLVERACPTAHACTSSSPTSRAATGRSMCASSRSASAICPASSSSAPCHRRPPSSCA